MNAPLRPMFALAPDTSISEVLSLPEGTVIRGRFRLSEAEERIKSNGAHYTRVLVEDATGHMTGCIWPQTVPPMNWASLPGAVRVMGRVRRHERRTYLLVQRISGLTASEMFSATALLPRRLCPPEALSALDRLGRFESSLPPALGRFLAGVLLDPQIGVPFLRCKASQGHHHAFAGGLLVHSTHLLGVVGQMTANALPDDRDAIPITQLGYLLHDIGKVRTVGELRRPDSGRHLRHEFLTGCLLGPHLDRLRLEESDAASTLSYILDFVDQPASTRGQAKFLGAEIVVACDRLSAASVRNRGRAALLGTVPPATNDEQEVSGVRFP